MKLSKQRIPDMFSEILNAINNSVQNGISIIYNQTTRKIMYTVLTDNITIELGSNKLQVKDNSIGKSKIDFSSIDAYDIPYSNYGFESTGEAIDELLYIPPTVTMSGGSNHEKGETVTSITLDWSYNKTITSQSLNNGIGDLDISLRTYTHSEQTITTNRTYTIMGSDGKNSCNASTSVSFYNKRYYGTSTDNTLDDSEILAQLTGEFSTTKTQTRTFDCTGGRYFYIIYPAVLGTATFKVGGLSFSDMNLTTRDFTNASGYTESYNIYRPNNIQTGSSILVEVS